MKISKEELLIETIISFEKKANEMINLLAEEFQLDLSQRFPFSRLMSRQNNLWKGSLSKIGLIGFTEMLAIFRI